MRRRVGGGTVALISRRWNRPMFDVSRTVLAVLAAIALVLLVFGLVASFFPGWVLGIILGAYVVVVLVRQRGPRPSSL
jgi:peptidoglycan/LPS O-acetylase OafA/YrhL